MQPSSLFGQNPAWKGVKQSIATLLHSILTWGAGLPARPLAIAALVLYGYIGIITVLRIARIIRSSFFDVSLIGLGVIAILCVYIVQLSVNFLRKGRL